MLTTLDPKVEILEASCLTEALTRIAPFTDAQLCLFDLASAEGDGIRGLRQLRIVAPEMAIAVVSSSEDAGAVHACLAAGAISYIPKSASPAVLMEALREVLAGRIYLPVHGGLDGPPVRPARPVVTSRQRDVLRGLCQGLPNKSIANRLGISEYTVREHIATLFRILGVANRTQAVIRSSRQYFRLRIWPRTTSLKVSVIRERLKDNVGGGRQTARTRDGRLLERDQAQDVAPGPDAVGERPAPLCGD
jgi:DNA-binding NarL/FixJ family response regulator